jgi:hypothetical protein
VTSLVLSHGMPFCIWFDALSMGKMSTVTALVWEFMAAPRDAHTRKADTLAELRARHADVWVGSASMDGARQWRT